MTRLEAIEHGKEQLEIFGGEHRKFIELSIKALEQEPCGDAVSRMAINNLRKYILIGGIPTVSLIDVNKLPPANPQEPKTGHWIWELEDWNKWTCSECGYFKRTDIHSTLGYKYCPNCGAKMAESEDEDLKECQKCGFNSEYGYCECPNSDKWYACPIESKKPENIKALKEDADEFSESEEV